MRLFNKLAIQVVRLYQITLSSFIGMHCKFTPSCSQYACDCFASHGFLKSFGLMLWRILRCNPWSQGGHDPAVKPTPHHH
ncbi:membrane protein insertion efficiency factor YidD [Polynucleobacter corsicus]|uniref:membrane protein insertion efficiency factor YidD n=1 Tax=Polynucleobacter corsicus TaxID=2081042 RepID=UPI001BFEC40E|nr:membrane protein insertion efficiency factor YidD [Polynucleobacter corsicus]QWE18686.1 membrane protein insertion efficiency factor YidD [Polynucleobacter corsicus]